MHLFSGACQITATCDNTMYMYIDGVQRLVHTDWTTSATLELEHCASVVAIKCDDVGGAGGIIASTSNDMITDNSWKCTANYYSGWESTLYDDSSWPSAYQIGPSYSPPWGYIAGIKPSAQWIWTTGWEGTHTTVYCRRRLRHLGELMETSKLLKAACVCGI